MPSIIAVLAQKGGVGKTSVCHGLAVAYARAEWAVKVADFDVAQATSTARNRRRIAAQYEPALSVETVGNVAQAMKGADSFDLLIMDSAPHATKTAVDIAKVADLILIPTGPSLDDLEPAALLANHLVRKEGIPAQRIAFVLNLMRSSKEADDARATLDQTGFATLEGYIPNRPAFTRAHDLGQSFIESPYKSVREQAEQVIDAAISKLRELTE